MPTEKAHGLQIAKMCEAFADLEVQNQKIKVNLVIPSRKNPIKESIFDYYQIKKNFKITKLTCLSFGKFPKLNFWLQSLSFAISALLYSLFKRSDFIYSRDIGICFILSFFNKNVVFEDHEPPLSKKFFYKIFLKKIRKKVLVARNLEEIYKNLGINQKSYMIAPNGVDLNEFAKANKNKNLWKEKFNLAKEDKIVLYTGHFYKWKGIYTLIDSAKFLDNNIKIVLFGGYPQNQREIKEYIENNKIKNIFLHEFIPHKKIIPYLKSADILVLPNTSKEERSSKYTTPIKMFEYMASNVPIVASNLESFSFYLKNEINAVLFEPDNSKNLANKINFLFQNKKIAEKIAEKAYEDVQKYSWIKRAEKIIKFITN